MRLKDAKGVGTLFLIILCSSFSLLAKPVPVIYVTGPASVCPGVSYTYQLYTNGCVIDSYSWNVTGGTVTNQGPTNPVFSGVVTTISIQWTTNGTKTVSANVTTICNQTVAGFVNGTIAFQTNSLQPATPSAPSITSSSSSYCPGDVINLSADASENSNGVTYDDV